MSQKKLFTPLKLRSLEFKNRIWVSPMCQYSSENGHPTDWHLVHLGSRAVGGAGLVMVEATAVLPEGRISPDDSGIWSDDHIASFQRLTRFIKQQGSIAGIQLAHAGRKASTAAPWLGGKLVGKTEGGWTPLAPSPVPFSPGTPPPQEMTLGEIEQAVHAFEKAAVRALKAGFEIIELHFAHGYLVHEFLSPLSNHRTDTYGGKIENRMRLALEIAAAVRKQIPETLPLFARISATDWADGAAELDVSLKRSTEGWALSDSLELCHELKALGVDLIDCSTGGTLEKPQIPVGPGYQVPFSESIRKEVGIATGAVGMITDPDQAEAILAAGQADAILMAREFLRNPYWPVTAARHFELKPERPKQYLRS